MRDVTKTHSERKPPATIGDVVAGIRASLDAAGEPTRRMLASLGIPASRLVAPVAASPTERRREHRRRATTIEHGDVPAEVVAGRLGVALEELERALPNLRARGFPAPDPDTGNFDIGAIDAWRRARHPHLFAGATIGPLDANTVVSDRLAILRGAKRG